MSAMVENSWTLYNFPGMAVMTGQGARIDSANVRRLFDAAAHPKLRYFRITPAYI